MALEEYLGSIVMEIDGKEIDIESLDETVRTGRKVVKTMNRSGRAKGYARGMTDYELRLSVAVPLSGETNWAGVDGAKITVYPLDSESSRTQYLDCFVTEVGSAYNVEGEAKRNISMVALRKVVE